ncbi:stage IV sporulation protein A [Faecalimonas sp.]
MNTFHLYKDIQARTKGEIYIGVVGPVRTGKSTFIKRFMDLLVLPHIEDEHTRMQTRDELPQSASGKTIMTTEPKFIPKEAAKIELEEGITANIRLIDCVGYMVEGAAGHIENDEERQVKTPWFEHEIPFTKAATIGTQKVIREHSTIGIVITTDGSIGELKRENYIEAEKNTIRELQRIGKPFIVLVNSKKPYGEEAKSVKEQLEEQYAVTALTVNCEQLRQEDIHQIMQSILFEFPIAEVQFYIPKWVEMLPMEHRIKQDLLLHVKEILNTFSQIKDVKKEWKETSDYIEEVRIEEVKMDSGSVKVRIQIGESFYYEVLSEVTGECITSEYDLVGTMKELSMLRKEYEGVKDAMDSVRLKGYGAVSPMRNEIKLDDPIMIKQGNKFGVKIHSEAPSVHLIKANIETDIAPIVGSQQQAEDLLKYIKETKETEEGMWKVNIFGKSIEELVTEGMKNKMMMINDESQVKLQDTMQKIVNDSNGGLVCIII